MQNRQYTVPNSGALAINIIICIQLLDPCCLTPLQIDWTETLLANRIFIAYNARLVYASVG